MWQKFTAFLAAGIISVLAGHTAIYAQSSQGVSPAEGSRCVDTATLLPSYVVIVDDDASPADLHLSDSLFYATSGRTIFRVNKTVLDVNSGLCNELISTVLPLARTEGWGLAGIELRGSASPEGTYEHNKWLAEHRAAALHRFISDYLGDDATAFTSIVTVPEDYDYLLWLLERDGDGAAPVLRSLIARYPSDPIAIKEGLKKVGGGSMWRRLVTDYYPFLRNARVVFYFTRQMRRPEPMEQASATLVPLTVDAPTIPDPLHFNISIERPHMLSLSSNLLYDAFYMPGYGWAPMVNLNAEFYPLRGNFTFRAGFTFPYYHRWSRHKFFQIRDYHLEVRRYFNPGLLHTGTYLGAFINANKYGIGLGPDKGWEGEGAGASLKLGYVLPLGGGRWRLDFHIAAGGYYTRFDPYVWGNPVTGEIDGKYYYDYTGAIADFNKRSHRRWWLGPTEVGVTLTFDLLYYRILGGGASCRRKEVVIP